MARIRPPVRPASRPAPGIGAAIGAGLQGLSEALETIGEVRTNIQLLDIEGQIQVEQLEQRQFEKVELSEAISQFTLKQISRNETSGQILQDARERRSYEDVQQKMSDWNADFDETLFEGRTPEFVDRFLIMDRPAVVGQINKLGTAIEVGRLGLIRDNHVIAAQNLVASVNASTDPEELVDQFDLLRQSAVNAGFKDVFIEQAIDVPARVAMEGYIRALPLIDGLAALSDPIVAGVLGEDGRERMRRDLNTKASTLRRAQEITSEAHWRVTGVDVLDAFAGGESETILRNRIEGDSDISDIRKKDMLDFLDVLAAAREKGPQEVDPEIISANQELSKLRIGTLVKRAKVITDKKDLSEEDRKELSQISEEALVIYSEAVLKEEEGAFGSTELIKRRYQIWPITEGFAVVEEIAKRGFLGRVAEVAAFILSPASALSLKREADETQAISLRVPSSIVSRTIADMFLGEGRYGELSSTDKASVEVFLIDQANKTENSNKPLPTEEANAMAQEIFAVVDKRFLVEEKGVAPENLEEVGGLILNSGPPATKPRQQPRVGGTGGLVDQINEDIARGRTRAQIIRDAKNSPGFDSEAFNKAFALSGALTAEGGRTQAISEETVGLAISSLSDLSETTRDSLDSAAKKIIPDLERLSNFDSDTVKLVIFSIGEREFKLSDLSDRLNELLSADKVDEESVSQLLGAIRVRRQ